MRLGCGRMSVVIEEIDQISSCQLWQPVRVDAQRNRRVLVAELLRDVGDGRSPLQQQRGKRVSQLVRAATMQARPVQQAIERLADIRLRGTFPGDRSLTPYTLELADVLETEPMR